jgi:hypothetical protein
MSVWHGCARANEASQDGSPFQRRSAYASEPPRDPARVSFSARDSAQLSDHGAGQAQQGVGISQELEQMASYLHSLAERFNR